MGNQDEVVMRAYFIFNDIETNAAIFSEEHIGPLIIKQAEAKVVKLSANMKRQNIIRTIDQINSKTKRDETVTMGQTLKKKCGINF